MSIVSCSKSLSSYVAMSVWPVLFFTSGRFVQRTSLVNTVETCCCKAISFLKLCECHRGFLVSLTRSLDKPYSQRRESAERQQIDVEDAMVGGTNENDFDIHEAMAVLLVVAVVKHQRVR